MGFLFHTLKHIYQRTPINPPLNKNMRQIPVKFIHSYYHCTVKVFLHKLVDSVVFEFFVHVVFEQGGSSFFVVHGYAKVFLHQSYLNYFERHFSFEQILLIIEEQKRENRLVNSLAHTDLHGSRDKSKTPARE